MAAEKSERDAGLLAALAVLSGRQLALCLGIDHAAVSRWRSVPAHRIIEVEAVTGVPREVLRPDLYQPREEV